MSGPKPQAPLLRVVTPDATPEEVAALVAVLAALGTKDARPRRPRSAWADPRRRMRSVPASGPGAWRASGQP